MKLVVLPEAELEAGDAAIWYDDQRLGLGDEFEAEFRRVRERISESPQQWPRMEFYEGRHDVGRCFMDRFPFGVVFVRRPEELVVPSLTCGGNRFTGWNESTEPHRKTGMSIVTAGMCRRRHYDERWRSTERLRRRCRTSSQ